MNFPPVKYNITLEFYPNHLIQELKVERADDIYISDEEIIIKKGKATMKFGRDKVWGYSVEGCWY